MSSLESLAFSQSEQSPINVKWKPLSSLKRAFPDNADPVACFKKGPYLGIVALDIPVNLLPPEALPRLWPSEKVTVGAVTVPEAPMDEQHRVVLGEDHIGLPRQFFCMEPVAEPGSMES